MAGVYQFKNGSEVIFEFLEMSPAPQKAHNRQTYLVRSNVDGAAVYQDGFRGELFNLATAVDEQNATDGQALIASYAAAVGTIYSVIYQNVDYGPYLLHAVATNGYSIINLIGGKSGANPKYMVEANWTLYPTSTS